MEQGQQRFTRILLPTGAARALIRNLGPVQVLARVVQKLKAPVVLVDQSNEVTQIEQTPEIVVQ